MTNVEHSPSTTVCVCIDSFHTAYVASLLKAKCQLALFGIAVC